MDYNKTINLPKTDFPMRAGLPAREPGMLEGWEKLDLYHELLKKNEGKPLFLSLIHILFPWEWGRLRGRSDPAGRCSPSECAP